MYFVVYIFFRRIKKIVFMPSSHPLFFVPRYNMLVKNSNLPEYLKGFAPMPPAPCFFVEWWLRGEVVT